MFLNLAEEKIPVSFVCNGFDVETGQWIAIGTGSGENHMRCIDEGIARIDLNKGGRSIEDSLSFFEATMKEEDLHIVISTSQSVTFQKFLQLKKNPKLQTHNSETPFVSSNDVLFGMYLHTVYIFIV